MSHNKLMSNGKGTVFTLVDVFSLLHHSCTVQQNKPL